jgi:hypothetical protein
MVLRKGLVRARRPPAAGPGPFSRALALVLLALLPVAAIALAAGSFLSYDSVKTVLDASASDGDADLTSAEFGSIVTRLRIAAVLAFAAGAGGFLARHRLAGLLGTFGDSARREVQALVDALRAGLAAESRAHLGALMTVILLGLVVRIEFLFQPMRYDEAGTSVHYVSQPWYIPVTTYTAPNNHVLHSVLAQITTSIFGSAPWALRLPALIAGILLIPATYLVGRAFYGRNAGLLAAALVAGASILVEYSTNARGYTLVALLFVLLLALARHLRTSWAPAAWAAFAVLGALGFFTVPVMLYPFGAVVTWLAAAIWLEGRDQRLLYRRLAPAVLATGTLTILLYLPILATSGVGALTSNEFVQPQSFSYVADELPDSVRRVASGWHRDLPLAVTIVLAVAFTLAIVFHRRLARQPVPPAAASLVWIVPVVLAQRVVPFERVWLFLLPLYLVTAAAGLAWILRRSQLVATLAVVASTALVTSAFVTRSVYHSEDTSTFRDGEQVARFVETRLEPGQKVLVAPPADLILEYWLERRGLEAAELVYWQEPPARLLVVVKEGPRDYPLNVVLADPRLADERLGSPVLVERFDETSIFEIS